LSNFEIIRQMSPHLSIRKPDRKTSNNSSRAVCMVVGLQQLDKRSVRLLVGHDGSLMEHSTRPY